MSKRVDLVFRTVGERTSEVALELAVAHIRPEQVHVLEGVTPFARTVREQLQLSHDCDTVVYVDADCLILEDLRPFLDWNEAPYVDCYVHDRFRGHIHCGVHITSIELVDAMREVTPDPDDLAYVLRPESATRNLAMRAHGWSKHLRGFRILHDHHQWHTHLFEKYALRELRSRTPQQRGRLDGAVATWGEDDDHRVARRAIAHAREHVRTDAPSADVHDYICALPRLAAEVVPALGLPPQEPLSIDDLPPRGARTPRPHVFGLGLSRTGTRSLTAALHVLGWHTVHYPTDADTLSTLARGDADFRLLEQFDGLTDITVSHLYRELDRRFPDARFVLTVRDEEAWLDSCRRHWDGRPAWDDPTKPSLHLEIRRFLRAAVYGCYAFEPERFGEVYRAHVRDVVAYFADRPEKLLVLPLTAGAGWQPLCDFLGAPVPAEPMPHKGGGLKARQPGLELRD